MFESLQERLGSILNGLTGRGRISEADVDAASVSSNTFTLEWPPRSGRMRSFPEIDRAEWMAIDDARTKILASQRPLIDALVELLAPAASPGPSS